MMEINKNIKAPIKDKYKIYFVLFYFILLNGFINSLRKILFKKIIKPKKILIFRTGSLGDSICAIPSIIAIKENFPNAQIDILSNSGLQNLVSMQAILSTDLYNNYIDYLGVSRIKLTHKLRSNKYDVVIQLTQNQAKFYQLVRDIFFFRFIIKIKSGFGWEYATVRFWRRLQEKYIKYPNEISRLLESIQRNGLKVDQKLQFNLKFGQSDLDVVSSELQKIKQYGNNPIISMVIGAKRPQNRWPIDNFKYLALELSKHFSVAIIGSKEDSELARPLDNIPGVYNLCGKFTPIQSGLFIKTCIICITNDTGPMHLSYAFGTTVVAIFSARDFPYKWYPPEGNLNHVFRSFDVPCSICLSETCTNNICMQEIHPSVVLEKVFDIIKIKENHQ